VFQRETIGCLKSNQKCEKKWNLHETICPGHGTPSMSTLEQGSLDIHILSPLPEYVEHRNSPHVFACKKLFAASSYLYNSSA
jgi:hypothetical protein